MVEIDDDFAALPATNHTFAVTHPRRHRDFNLAAHGRRSPRR